MKKTISIAALAVSASTTFAFMAPPVETKTYCLKLFTSADGMMAGTCDQSRNNANTGVQVGANGCAADQVSLTTAKYEAEADFPIQIRPCLPPNISQL